MLRFASFISVLNTVFMCVLLIYVQYHVSSFTLYQLLLTNQVVYGVRRGVGQPAFEAIFGDSVASGKRSRIYSQRSSLQKLGNAVGPAVAAAIFFTTGDKWTEAALTYVLLAGNLLRLVPATLQCLFRDTRSLGEESEGLHVRRAAVAARETAGASADSAAAMPSAAHPRAMLVEAATAPATACPHDNRTPMNRAAAPARATTACGDEDGTVAAAVGLAVEPPAVEPPAAEPPAAEPLPDTHRSSRLGPQHVAPIIAVANLTARIGSGLSVRYFSLYFWKELHMRPAYVMLLLVAAQVGGSAATIAAQRVSLVIGRVQVCIAFRLVGVGMLVAMALSPLQRPLLIVPLYLLRTWFVQSPIGLAKSVLNDYVSKKHRAKWNALESLNLFSWSGSSFIGGYLISAFDATPHLQQYGFDITFLITACLQACSILCLVPLLRIVPSEDALKQLPLADPAGHEAVHPLTEDAGGGTRVARVAYGAPPAPGGGVEPLLMPASVPQLQPPGSVQR